MASSIPDAACPGRKGSLLLDLRSYEAGVVSRHQEERGRRKTIADSDDAVSRLRELAVTVG
jgi:hypothetical protein